MPPLSHSSAMTLTECEYKYFLYKIEKAKPDADYVKSDALAIGSAFHWILEKSKHEKPESITQDLEACAKDPDIGLAEDDFPLVHAMVLKYLRLHKRMGLKVLAIEIEIKTNWMHGYVDAVLEDGEGNWWVVDLKTYKSLHMPSLASLPKDPQLNLYAAHHGYVADLLGLLPEKFAGVRWRVCTKTTAKQKKGEEMAAYIQRLANDHVSAYDIPVPKALMNFEERLEIHKELWERSGELRILTPRKNFKNCFSYYSPCAYFSRCHSAPISEIKPLDITVEE